MLHYMQYMFTTFDFGQISCVCGKLGDWAKDLDPRGVRHEIGNQLEKSCLLSP